MESFDQIQDLIEFCKSNGFLKKELVEQYNLINKLLLKNGLYYDALVRI
jgi:hypothetical protein